MTNSVAHCIRIFVRVHHSFKMQDFLLKKQTNCLFLISSTLHCSSFATSLSLPAPHTHPHIQSIPKSYGFYIYNLAYLCLHHGNTFIFFHLICRKSLITGLPVSCLSSHQSIFHSVAKMTSLKHI